MGGLVNCTSPLPSRLARHRMPSGHDTYATYLPSPEKATNSAENLVDGGVEVAVDVDEGVRPEPLLQLLPRYNLARTLQQNGEHLKRLAAEIQFEHLLAQFPGA